MVKQRCFSPNHPKTAVSNREHIRYIATRSGVVANHGMGHGLFGSAFGMEPGDIADLKAFQRKVKEVSERDTVLFRCVVSLHEDDAIRKGFDQRQAWEQAITAQLGGIAEAMRIPVDRLEWCAAVHMDKDHPHTHLIYWEREQGVRKAWIHPQQSNAIRMNFIKDIFADELAELYEVKNEARAAVGLSGSAAVSESAALLAGMDKEEYAALLDEMKATDPALATPRLPYSKIKLSHYRPLLAGLLELKHNLPKTGRLSYKLMPPEVKEQIDGLAQTLFALNPDCRREYQRYINAAMEIAEMYTTKETTIRKAGEKARQEMKTKIGNLLLKAARELEAEQQPRQYRQQEQLAVLVQEVFSLLSSALDQQEAAGRSAARGDLSKQAKKELAMEISQGAEQ